MRGEAVPQGVQAHALVDPSPLRGRVYGAVELPRGGGLTAAKRSSAVLRWFGTHINPRLAATLSPAVRLVQSDVAAHLGVDRRWDVIVLDVDNGPAALSTIRRAGVPDV